MTPEVRICFPDGLGTIDIKGNATDGVASLPEHGCYCPLLGSMRVACHHPQTKVPARLSSCVLTLSAGLVARPRCIVSVGKMPALAMDWNLFPSHRVV